MKAVFLGLLLVVSSAQAKIIQFLYIEASEGNSSGGHVALQIGSEVYHYQYEDARIRLFKHNAEAFRVNYQLLQNRTIHAAEIEVSDSTFDRINSHFKVRFFSQSQYLKNLQNLQQDQALLKALLQSKSGTPIVITDSHDSLPKLTGAGLFYNGDNLENVKKTVGICNTIKTSATVIAKVRQQVENRYGKDFLSQKINGLIKEISYFSPLGAVNISSHYTFSGRYSDLLNGLLALRVLHSYQPLVSNACFQMNLPILRMSESEIRLVQEFQQKLLLSAQSLMASKRPDWGHAMFVTLARLIVIEQSIEAHHWTFLDDTDEKIQSVPNQQLELYNGQLQKQRQIDFQRLQDAVSELKANSGSYERRYAGLEMAVNHYQQWLESDKTGVLRYQSEQPLPKKSIPSTRFLLSALSIKQLENTLHHLEQAEKRLLSEYRRLNAYHLLTNNCVTALFEQIDQSVAGESKQLLGGDIDPKINIIPFQAFDSVQEQYNVKSIKELPAYRQEELSKMYDQEFSAWVYARESNILSSSLYKHNPDDAWFVFFTDDALLLRPLFGAVNTLAAASQSVFGLMRWPIDGGREIKIGLRGFLASLPELAFINIRKGSYPYPMRH